MATNNAPFLFSAPTVDPARGALIHGRHEGAIFLRSFMSESGHKLAEIQWDGDGEVEAIHFCELFDEAPRATTETES